MAQSLRKIKRATSNNVLCRYAVPVVPQCEKCHGNGSLFSSTIRYSNMRQNLRLKEYEVKVKVNLVIYLTFIKNLDIFKAWR
jgi:hypothetical protein